MKKLSKIKVTTAGQRSNHTMKCTSTTPNQCPTMFEVPTPHSFRDTAQTRYFFPLAQPDAHFSNLYKFKFIANQENA